MPQPKPSRSAVSMPTFRSSLPTIVQLLKLVSQRRRVHGCVSCRFFGGYYLPPTPGSGAETRPPRACVGVKRGVFRGFKLRIRLPIIPVIVGMNPVGQPPRGRLDTTPLPPWKGGIRSPSPRGRKAVTSAPESLHSRANPRFAAAVSRPPALQRFPPLQRTGIGPLQKTLDTASTHCLVHPHARGEHC